MSGRKKRRRLTMVKASFDIGPCLYSDTFLPRHTLLSRLFLRRSRDQRANQFVQFQLDSPDMDTHLLDQMSRDIVDSVLPTAQQNLADEEEEHLHHDEEDVKVSLKKLSELLMGNSNCCHGTQTGVRGSCAQVVPS